MLKLNKLFKLYIYILTIIGSLVVSMIGVLIIYTIIMGIPIKYSAQSSPSGEYSVYGIISDRGVTVSADYYTDIVILDKAGKEVAKWDDIEGQVSVKGARELIDSIVWLDDDKIKFNDYTYGEYVLEVNKSPKG